MNTQDGAMWDLLQTSLVPGSLLLNGFPGGLQPTPRAATRTAAWARLQGPGCSLVKAIPN